MRNLRHMSQIGSSDPYCWVPLQALNPAATFPMNVSAFFSSSAWESTYLLCARDDIEDPPLGPDASNSVLIRGMEATGVVDVGYRSIAGFQGNQDYYRSVVNLGNGPRLLFANLDFQSPLGTKKYFDKLHFDASAWGGDPYNTMRSMRKKAEVYEFNFNYRNVDYYNYIPTFANPLLLEGVLVGQHSYDTAIRTMDFDLTLRPGKKISPLFGLLSIFWIRPGDYDFHGSRQRISCQ